MASPSFLFCGLDFAFPAGNIFLADLKGILFLESSQGRRTGQYFSAATHKNIDPLFGKCIS
jgi:hypothetical protein